MLPIRRILFPTDYAPCADRAFAHASFLAGRLGAELHVLHVDPVTGPATARAFTYEVPDGVARVDVTVRASSPAQAIVRAAREADLVVMGTHGRRGVQRVALGSTAEQVLRGADCPVLAVGIDAKRTTPMSVERILVPVDFSDSSGPALAIAGALAGFYHARVDALHAAYLPDLPDIYGLGLQFSATYPAIVSRSREALRSLLARFVDAPHRGHATIQVSPPVPTILEAAEGDEVGLVVMPTHGRTGLERLAQGSVAAAVLRRAPCAVLALPSYGRLPLPDDADLAPPRPQTHTLDAALADALAQHDI